jgi:hypothetical protein
MASTSINCDISQGKVTVSNQNLACPAANGQISSETHVIITGSSAANAIVITDSKVALTFSSLSLSGSSYFRSVGSSVSIRLEGSNTISLTGDNTPVQCALSGNVSLTSLSDWRLDARKASNDHDHAVIGTKMNEFCQDILIENATVTALDGRQAGIGTGHAQSGQTSFIVSLKILNSIVTAWPGHWQRVRLVGGQSLR